MQYQSNHILIDDDDIYRFNMAVDIDSDIIIEADTYEPVNPYEPGQLSLQQIYMGCTLISTFKSVEYQQDPEHIKCTVANYTDCQINLNMEIIKQLQILDAYDNLLPDYNAIQITYKSDNTLVQMGSVFVFTSENTYQIPYKFDYDYPDEDGWYTQIIRLPELEGSIIQVRIDPLDELPGYYPPREDDIIRIKDIRFIDYSPESINILAKDIIIPYGDYTSVTPNNDGSVTTSVQQYKDMTVGINPLVYNQIFKIAKFGHIRVSYSSPRYRQMCMVLSIAPNSQMRTQTLFDQMISQPYISYYQYSTVTQQAYVYIILPDLPYPMGQDTITQIICQLCDYVTEIGYQVDIKYINFASPIR